MSDAASRVIAECKRIARMSDEPGRTTRLFLTPAMHEVHVHLRTRMEALGMLVRVDAAGNLRGMWQPANPGTKRLLIGSHIDTVPNAGAYDGVLGVVLGLTLIEKLRGRRFRFGIEVIAFSEEEGIRFGVPFLGSLALIGAFDSDLLELRDAGGCT